MQAARHGKHYASSGIAAHPCKERKDGAPTLLLQACGVVIGKMKTFRQSFSALALLLAASFAHAASYQYIRIGNKNDIQTKPAFGIAMMGGGSDLDEAFRWLCQKGNGGDFLILRASGSDAYNSYINGLCKLNSVATLILSDRQAAQDPAVAEIIRQAEVIFIAGGDQANYVRDWKDTPVQDAINANLAEGKPIGGTSAGLAVLGEFVYGALGDPPDGGALVSAAVLLNPYAERVTLVRGFLKIPHLENLLTDSHFAKRDRMGRTLGFLARIMQDGWSKSPREVAIDEKSAVLVEPDGKGTVLGSGKGAYFLRPTQKPEACQKDEPLTFQGISVYRVPAGGHFDLTSWTGDGGTAYSLSVEKGKIDSTQANHGVY
jgi:cyanophycinase